MGFNNSMSSDDISSSPTASILVVDDDPADCRETTMFLRSALKSCRVEALVGPNQVIDMIANFRPSLVLLDLDLPDHRNILTPVCGLNLLIDIKTHYNMISVVVLSGIEEPWVLIEALRLGASHYVTKFDPKEKLIRIIKNELSNTIPYVMHKTSQEQHDQILYKLTKTREHFNLRQEKLYSLERAKILETNPSALFNLDHEIESLKRQLSEDEKTISTLERQLRDE